MLLVTYVEHKYIHTCTLSLINITQNLVKVEAAKNRPPDHNVRRKRVSRVSKHTQDECRSVHCGRVQGKRAIHRQCAHSHTVKQIRSNRNHRSSRLFGASSSTFLQTDWCSQLRVATTVPGSQRRSRRL